MSSIQRSHLWLASGLLVLAAVFATDVLFPLGAVIGTLYILVSLSALSVSGRSALVLAAVATFANVLASCLAPGAGIPDWIVATNRVFAVCTTWLLILIGMHFHRQSQRVNGQLREQNERLRLALEAADVGFWGSDLSTGEIAFDERWLAKLGYTPHDVQYTAAWYEALVHPDDRQRLQVAWQKHLSGQSDSLDIEHRLRAKTGNWRTILTKGRVIDWDSAGTPLRAAGTHLDVTATRELERQTEQALRDRNRELQLVTDAIPMMIGYVDQHERVQFHNTAFDQYFATSPQGISGMLLSDLLGSRVYEKVRGNIGDALDGKRVQFEESIARADGNYWWLVHLLPRQNDGGRVLGFYILVTDMTCMKQSAEEVDRQREALALNNRRSAANEMAAAIAHELNQPLGAIAVYSRGLVTMRQEGRNDSEELDHALNTIHREAKRAGEIMRRVRELVDNRQLRTASTNVGALLESVRSICEIRTLASRVPVEVRIEEHVSTIDADAVQLQQVLVNLITNAIEASDKVPDDRKRVTVEVSGSFEGTHIRVIDRGHGLSGPRLKRIFKPYYTTKPEGLGIGLNICQSIVDAHGGRLWATQNQEFGATFHVLLPFQAANSSPQLEAVSRIA